MDKREEVEVIVKYLARTKYSDSICPRREIAGELVVELESIGIPRVDHFLAVCNMMGG